MKVEIANDIKIMGVGVIRKGTKVDVKEKNKRFVYVDYYGNILKLSLKDIM